MSSALLPVAKHTSGDEKSGITTLDFLMSLNGVHAGIKMSFERQGFGRVVTAWTGQVQEFASAMSAGVSVSATKFRISLDNCITQYDQGSVKGGRIKGDATFTFPNEFYSEIGDHVRTPPQTAV